MIEAFKNHNIKAGKMGSNDSVAQDTANGGGEKKEADTELSERVECLKTNTKHMNAHPGQWWVQGAKEGKPEQENEEILVMIKQIANDTLMVKRVYQAATTHNEQLERTIRGQNKIDATQWIVEVQDRLETIREEKNKVNPIKEIILPTEDQTNQKGCQCSACQDRYGSRQDPFNQMMMMIPEAYGAAYSEDEDEESDEEAPLTPGAYEEPDDVIEIQDDEQGSSSSPAARVFWLPAGATIGRWCENSHCQIRRNKCDKTKMRKLKRLKKDIYGDYNQQEQIGERDEGHGAKRERDEHILIENRAGGAISHNIGERNGECRIKKIKTITQIKDTKTIHSKIQWLKNRRHNKTRQDSNRTI